MLLPDHTDRCMKTRCGIFRELNKYTILCSPKSLFNGIFAPTAVFKEMRERSRSRCIDHNCRLSLETK